MKQATQGTLFEFEHEHGASRITDPITSQEAAASVDVCAKEAAVLACLIEHGPATIQDVADRTGIPVWTVSPRFRPLVRKGLIEDSGKKKKGPSGRRAIIWRAA